MGLCIKILSRFVCIWEKWTSGGQKKSSRPEKISTAGEPYQQVWFSLVLISVILFCARARCWMSLLVFYFDPRGFCFLKSTWLDRKNKEVKKHHKRSLKTEHWNLQVRIWQIGFKTFLVFFAKCSYKLVNYKLCGNKATFQSFILNTQKGDLWICQLCHVIKAFQDTWHICLFTHSFTCSI